MIWHIPRFSENVDASETRAIHGNGICDSGEICDETITDNPTGSIWLQNAILLFVYYPCGLDELRRNFSFNFGDVNDDIEYNDFYVVAVRSGS